MAMFFCGLSRLSPETMMEYLGPEDHEAIWQEMKADESHRDRAIDWLEGMILTQVTGEMAEMNKPAQSLKVQEASRTSKGIAMKKFVDKEKSSQCQIEAEVITEHLRKTWVRPESDFIEAEEDSSFHLGGKIMEREENDLGAFMLDETNTAEPIKPREDLNASEIGGIGYRVMKRAGTAGVRFMKLLVAASIRNGRVMSTWKEAKMILLHKKGNRGEIGNSRSISITNWIYQIFPCLMARAFQDINSRVSIFSDNQKGFIKKTNGFSEHVIVLNEVLHNANRTRDI
jgi:hypothetical protein